MDVGLMDGDTRVKTVRGVTTKDRSATTAAGTWNCGSVTGSGPTSVLLKHHTINRRRLRQKLLENQCRDNTNHRRECSCHLANTTDSIQQPCVRAPYPDSRTLDPDPDPDRHRNPNGWSLGRTPPLLKISSKSVNTFLRCIA